MLRHTLPKEERISLRDELNLLFASKESFVSYPFRVLYAWVPYQEGLPVKMMVSVPKKKLRHAVDRNRMKRLLREAYRQNKHPLRESIERKVDKRTLLVGFIYLPEKTKRYSKVLSAVISALEHLIMISENEDIQPSEKSYDAS